MVVGFEATMSGRLADITNSETETVALKPIVAPELTTMPQRLSDTRGLLQHGCRLV